MRNALFGVASVVHPYFMGGMLSLFSRKSFGTNVYEKDWDVLVILDTARTDAMKHAKDDFEFIKDVDPIWSVGSASATWYANTFVEKYRDEIENTVLITENSHTTRVLRERIFPEEERDLPFAFTDWSTVEAETFQHIIETWKATEVDLSAVTSRMVTDTAIQMHREDSPDRMILHYQRPHSPYRVPAKEAGRDQYEYELNPFSYIRNGGDREKVMDAYYTDLRYVLSEVELLCRSIDADTIAISADHGDGFGEYGVVYSHPIAVPAPEVRRVPWVVTSANNDGEHEPEEVYMKTDNPKAKAMDQLKALGYK